MSDANAGIYTYYRCLTCLRWVPVANANYHPWCMQCINDEFDWANPQTEKPEE